MKPDACMSRVNKLVNINHIAICSIETTSALMPANLSPLAPGLPGPEQLWRWKRWMMGPRLRKSGLFGGLALTIGVEGACPGSP